MSEAVFQQLENLLARREPSLAFDFLENQFREAKKYPHLFETYLMRKRFELGLPLIQVGPLDLPDAQRRAYEESFVQAAREVGRLYLADGNIPRAWPYFRAIGETAPVKAAIEALGELEDITPVVEIAFYEKVHPVKGFELILSQYGSCRAISSLLQFPGVEGREECLAILIRRLSTELVENLRRTISQVEGQTPESANLAELLKNRDWLFESHAYYIDTSHVQSVLQMSIDSRDEQILRQALDLAEYATHLSSMYQYGGQPPLENFGDYAVYFRTVLGVSPEEGIQHFKSKLSAPDPEQSPSSPAQLVVNLLVRLNRPLEALDVFLTHLRQADPAQLSCPNAVQLCQMANAYDRLKEVSQQDNDLLSFAAASLQG
ncbi:MAG: hypothetical protein U0V70_13655 [Terriglobia bacterium]